MNTLTHEEEVRIEGGVFPFIPFLLWFGGMATGVVVSGVVGNVLNNWGDFKQGVVEGFNSTVNSN